MERRQHPLRSSNQGSLSLGFEIVGRKGQDRHCLVQKRDHHHSGMEKQKNVSYDWRIGLGNNSVAGWPVAGIAPGWLHALLHRTHGARELWSSTEISDP